MRLVILAICTFWAAAAQTTGIVTGRVLDSSGGILSGAKVSARHVDTGFTRAAATLPDGSYVLREMPAGAYEIRAEHPGFQPLVRKGVLLALAETLVIDLALQVGPIEQEITVTADAPPVNTSTAELSYLVGSQTIQRL